MRYRSKTIEIEANQFFYNEAVIGVRTREDGSCYVITIHDRETNIMQGDWIILENPPGDGTRAYPCKPDVFERRYEPMPKDCQPAIQPMLMVLHEWVYPQSGNDFRRRLTDDGRYWSYTPSEGWRHVDKDTGNGLVRIEVRPGTDIPISPSSPSMPCDPGDTVVPGGIDR